MWYMGIDQHKRHLTICVRDEQGDVALRRQVKTKWLELHEFLEAVRDEAAIQGGCVAVVEVRGFNRWLIRRLERAGCHRVYVITPPERPRQKTDRRDAAKLSELLWLNRDRIAAKERLIHVREVYQATDQEEYDRQLTHLRHRVGRDMTRIKNRIKGILRSHNLEQDCPTKGTFTKAGLAWLRTVNLPELEKLSMDICLSQYDLLINHIKTLDRRIDQRAEQSDTVALLRTVPRMGRQTALALAAHIGPIDRFAGPRALSNFFGLTPGSRSSGEQNRSGKITKAGHPFVRFLLCQMVLHALRGDPGLRHWYRQIKRRRGSNVARVAVMRRLCEKIWHILSKREPYQPVRPAPRQLSIPTPRNPSNKKSLSRVAKSERGS
jgi:transposase